MKYRIEKANDSDFDINLLQHCLDILNETDMPSNIRYRTSLILAGLQNEYITTFLITFLPKMSLEEFMQISFMATTNIERTEEFLRSNIKAVEGMTNAFRQFLVPKNKEVLIFS